jgi:hypothetical protein
MNYIVYFEIYGKKLRKVVDAKSMTEAKTIVLNSIIFHKVEPDPDLAEVSIKDLKEMLGIT